MTDALTAAREALASADELLPADESWHLRCRGGHWIDTFPNEAEAEAACEDRRRCDVGGCDDLTVVEHVTTDARPRSRSVSAAHLRAALARVDEITAEVEQLRGLLDWCIDAVGDVQMSDADIRDLCARIRMVVK